jgi:hypothetical protein
MLLCAVRIRQYDKEVVAANMKEVFLDIGTIRVCFCCLKAASIHYEIAAG